MTVRERADVRLMAAISRLRRPLASLDEVTAVQRIERDRTAFQITLGASRYDGELRGRMVYSSNGLVDASMRHLLDIRSSISIIDGLHRVENVHRQCQVRPKEL